MKRAIQLFLMIAVSTALLAADKPNFSGTWKENFEKSSKSPMTSYVNKIEQKDRLICVEKTYIDEKGEQLFDEKQQPTAKWKDLERLLGEYESDLERSREMCSILADYGLFEPFTMQANFRGEGAKPVQMTGMFRVIENNLENLNAAQLKNVIRKGILARVYMHLLSLENFGRLLDRKGTRKPD